MIRHVSYLFFFMLPKMLVRNIGRAFWNTLRVEKRFLASEPAKPQTEVQEGVEPVQVSTFILHVITISNINSCITLL